MTASAHALGAPITLRPGKARAATSRKPIPRQLRACRLMLSLASVCVAAVAFGTGQQIAVHGWKTFVFRAPGVGGTPARPDPHGSTALPGAPLAGPPAVPTPRHHQTPSSPARSHSGSAKPDSRSLVTQHDPVAEPSPAPSQRSGAQAPRHHSTRRPNPVAAGPGSRTPPPPRPPHRRTGAPHRSSARQPPPPPPPKPQAKKGAASPSPKCSPAGCGPSSPPSSPPSRPKPPKPPRQA